MAYTNFRYIAWKVPTVTGLFLRGKPGIISGWEPGTAPPPVLRVPVPDFVKNLDAKARLARLAAVVELTRARLASGVHGADNANTLKIFVVPEFYFRPPIFTGEYAFNTYPDHEAGKIFTALGEMFVNAAFKDWLFVCGTVMWNQRGLASPSGKGGKGAFPAIKPGYFNTAVQVRGGPKNGRQPRLLLIEKQVASDIDGVPVEKSAGNLAGVKRIYSAWPARKLHVFMTDGVLCGVEVCLDHLTKVLKQVVADYPGMQRGAKAPLKFHILTAGGMPVTPKSVCAKVGGYILRNDGMANVDPGGTVYDPTVEMSRVTGYEVRDPTGRYAPQFGLSPEDMHATATLDPAGITSTTYDFVDERYKVPIPPGGYFTMTQGLQFYNPLPMPTD